MYRGFYLITLDQARSWQARAFKAESINRQSLPVLKRAHLVLTGNVSRNERRMLVQDLENMIEQQDAKWKPS